MSENIARTVINSIEPIVRTGLCIDRLSGNELDLRMPLTGNQNHKGVMYAGSLFSLAEVAPGILFLNHFGDEEVAAICSGVDIKFRRPALSDITLKINISDKTFSSIEKELNEMEKARIEFILSLENTEGEAVSTATVKYVLLSTDIKNSQD